MLLRCPLCSSLISLIVLLMSFNGLNDLVLTFQRLFWWICTPAIDSVLNHELIINLVTISKAFSKTSRTFSAFFYSCLILVVFSFKLLLILKNLLRGTILLLEIPDEVIVLCTPINFSQMPICWLQPVEAAFQVLCTFEKPFSIAHRNTSNPPSNTVSEIRCRVQ